MGWLPLDGFPTYDASDSGHVRHVRLDRLVNPHVNQTGVVYVSLWRGGRLHARSLALLIARTFLDPPFKAAFDTPINRNGDRFNCSVENLVWRPRWFAIQYHQQFYDIPQWALNLPVRDRESREEFPSILEAAQLYGLLCYEILSSIHNGDSVFPTWQLFERTS